MNIDEAIERMESIIKTGTLGNTLIAYEAMLLGIEALKRIQECQEHHCTLSYIELPGETEE